MELYKTESPDTIVKYGIRTDFGEFNITDVVYGEDSSIIIIYQDVSAIAHCVLYNMRGLYRHDEVILNTKDSYLLTDDYEKTLEQCTEMMDFICQMYEECIDDEEIYDILYN